MSMPTFPNTEHSTPEESLSMILKSIAMEEIALSHIINAEGEKLQYVLGTLEKKLDKKASVSEILSVNKSVNSLLDSIAQNEMILKSKMESALGALSEYHTIGPTGPMGPAGPQGVPGPRGISCSASFLGLPEQRWDIETPLIWSCTEYSNCCYPTLSCDRKKILLDKNSYYSVNFSIDLCEAVHSCKYVTISLQTIQCGKKTDIFISHYPIVYNDSPFTVSSGGIFIPTKNNISELMLTLISPHFVKVKQSSILISEL